MTKFLLGLVVGAVCAAYGTIAGVCFALADDNSHDEMESRLKHAENSARKVLENRKR